MRKRAAYLIYILYDPTMQSPKDCPHLVWIVIVVCSWTSRKWSHISAKSSHSSSQVPPSLDRKKNHSLTSISWQHCCTTKILQSRQKYQLSKYTLWFVRIQTMFGLLAQNCYQQQILQKYFNAVMKCDMRGTTDWSLQYAWRLELLLNNMRSLHKWSSLRTLYKFQWISDDMITDHQV